jgi:hypothetical protein|tara:strand:+ start:113 stop:520 length:408 start_codon:yes stop_codon:yes gene_type:complete
MSLFSVIPWWIWLIALSIGFIIQILATCITLMAFTDGLFSDGEWKRTLVVASAFVVLIIGERWLAFGVILPSMGVLGLLVAPIFCLGPPILMCNKFWEMEWQVAIMFCFCIGGVAEGLHRIVVTPSVGWLVQTLM